MQKTLVISNIIIEKNFKFGIFKLNYDLGN